MTIRSTRLKGNQVEIKKVLKVEKIKKSGTIHKEAHISSRNRRNQAKKDERTNSLESN